MKQHAAEGSQAGGIQWFMVLAVLAGCSAGSGSDGGVDAGPTYDKPLFAVASTLSSGDTAATYVNLLPNLDVQTLNDADSLEYPGWTTIMALDGKLFVSDGETKKIQKYAVSDDGAMAMDAEISLMQVTNDPAFYSHTLVSSTKGYFQSATGVGRAVWNPQSMEVVGTVPGPSEVPLKRGDLNLFAGYDRGTATVNGKVFQPMYWVDEDWYRFDPLSQIVVYDGATDATIAVRDVNCTNLDKAAIAEDGTVYFSNWFYSPAQKYGPDGDGTADCMVRIKAGSTEVDPTFNIKWTDLTGGREAAAFSYVGNNKGIVAVFHHERLAAGADRADAVFTANWRYWWVDLETKTASMIESLDWAAAGYYSFHIDGRFFLLLPTADMSKTAIWELKSDGTATKLFETRGWAYQLVKIR